MIASINQTYPRTHLPPLQRTGRFGRLALLLALAATAPATAQFAMTAPVVLPAERGLDPSAVYTAERMEAQQSQSQLEAQLQQMQNQLQSQSRQLQSQTQNQTQGQAQMLNQAAPQPSSSPGMQPPNTFTNRSGANDSNWIEMNSLAQSFDGSSNVGNSENDITYANGDGSGYEYSEGYDEGFFCDLDCDCRKCRRRHLLGLLGGWCTPDIGGWLAGGYYNNAHGGNGSFGNSPLGFNNIAGAQLNQAWLYAENTVERGGGFDFGYRIDFMFGADGPDTQAFGDGQFDGDWDTSGQYGFAMPQLFVEGAYGNTSVKIGHFYTIMGYEVVTAPDNFFYSHAYTMYYNEPFTHTGILAQHDWSEDWTFYLGYTFGWDTGFTNTNDGATFLGGVTWSPSEYFSVTYATTLGDPGDDPVLTSDTYLHSIVVDTQLTDKIEWVVQSDFQNRQSAVADGKSYGLVNYLFYEWDDCTSFGMRYEWFRDLRGAAAVAGASENFHAITLGMNRSITDRLTVRPEVRFDWASRNDGFAGRAFDSGTENSQVTFGSQAIWTF